MNNGGIRRYRKYILILGVFFLFLPAFLEGFWGVQFRYPFLEEAIIFLIVVSIISWALDVIATLLKSRISVYGTYALISLVLFTILSVLHPLSFLPRYGIGTQLFLSIFVVVKIFATSALYYSILLMGMDLIRLRGNIDRPKNRVVRRVLLSIFIGLSVLASLGAIIWPLMFGFGIMPL